SWEPPRCQPGVRSCAQYCGSAPPYKPADGHFLPTAQSCLCPAGAPSGAHNDQSFHRKCRTWCLLPGNEDESQRLRWDDTDYPVAHGLCEKGVRPLVQQYKFQSISKGSDPFFNPSICGVRTRGRGRPDTTAETHDPWNCFAAWRPEIWGVVRWPQNR